MWPTIHIMKLLVMLLSSALLRHIRKIAKSGYSLRHVHPSVRMEQLGSHWANFHEIWCMRIFWKFIEKIQVSLQSDKNNRYFIWRPLYLHLRYLAHFFLEWNIFPTKAIEDIKTHILYSVAFLFRKSCRLWDNVQKYCRTEQVTDGNMAHAHCTLVT